MGSVEQLSIYPVKGLSRQRTERARVLEGGTLAHDRAFRLVDADGELLNGKRTARVHDLDTAYDVSTGVLTVATPDGERRRFDLAAEPAAAAEFLGDVFGTEVTVERAPADGGFVDRPELGPSVVSTATLRTVASWFDGMDLGGARRRFRANVEVGGVPAFWEDRFVGPDAPAFEVGGIRFEGATPCGRCVVPARDPDTGEAIDGFRERFVERRRAARPEWADDRAFEHYYSLTTIASVAERDRGRAIAEGDPVRALGE